MYVLQIIRNYELQVMIDSGKDYVKNQSAFATSLWELHSHFRENKTAQNALNKIITCFQVIAMFHVLALYVAE